LISSSPINHKGKHFSHWNAVITVCIGAFMAALDASIINVALPNLEQQFHARMNEIEWVSLSYLLSLASTILIFGKLADMFGRRWFYIFGFIIFSLSSLFCGLASSLSMLILFRVIQGIGAAMLQANSVSIITYATPKDHLGKAIGFQASAQGIGLSLGPVAGGALLSFINWKWLFFINLPVGLIGTILGIIFLPKDRVINQQKHKNFDYFGVFLLIPSIISIIYILNMGIKLGWSSLLMIYCYIIAVLAVIGFIQYERKQKDPLVDLTLFKSMPFTLGNVTGIMSYIIMYAVLLLTPYYFDQVKHLPIFQASLLITAIPIGMTISTPISGILSDNRGPALPSIAGLSMATIGALLLSIVNLTGTYILTSIGLLLVGAGIGMFTPPNNSHVMGNVPKNSLGVAGGILNMSRTLGMGLGITFGGISYELFTKLYGSSHHSFLVHTFRSAYFVVAVFAFITLIITVRNYKNDLKQLSSFNSDEIHLNG